MQKKLKAVATMGPGERTSLDRKSLQEVIGRVGPMTARMLSECCENAAGIPSSGASGLFGLAYGLGAFLDPTSKEHLYSVRGGTQRFALAIAERLPPGTIRLGCRVTSVRQMTDAVRVTYRDEAGEEHEVTAHQCISAVPAPTVLGIVEDLPLDKASALRRITPYSSLISIAWPVENGKSAPWDGVFVVPVIGPEGFNLLTNYGFAAKQSRPDLGGYLNTLSAGAKADLFEATDDESMLDRLYAEMIKIFPEARSLVDREGAVVKRWQRAGLPPVRPGYLQDRPLLRQSVGRIHFCGDYTSEPGLPGANNSGRHAAKNVSDALVARPQALIPQLD